VKTAGTSYLKYANPAVDSSQAFIEG
jgi:hypothetical protein